MEKIVKKFLPEYKSKVLNAKKAYFLFSKKYHPDRVDNLVKQHKLTSQQARERKNMFVVAEPYFARMRAGKNWAQQQKKKKAEREQWERNAKKASDKHQQDTFNQFFNDAFGSNTKTKNNWNF